MSCGRKETGRFYADTGSGLRDHPSQTGCNDHRIVRPDVSQFNRRVRPQVSGIIQKRFFTEGSEVKAGQVLQIDPALYQATGQG